MQIPAEVTIHQNTATCIREVEHFGYTAYHNICSGAVQYLDWGFGTWFVYGLFGLFTVGVIAFVVFALWDTFLN